MVSSLKQAHVLRHCCPECRLEVAIVCSREETAIRYDVRRWSRACPHSDLGSPLLCPCLGADVRAWLSPARVAREPLVPALPRV